MSVGVVLFVDHNIAWKIKRYPYQEYLLDLDITDGLFPYTYIACKYGSFLKNLH